MANSNPVLASADAAVDATLKAVGDILMTSLQRVAGRATAAGDKSMSCTGGSTFATLRVRKCPPPSALLLEYSDARHTPMSVHVTLDPNVMWPNLIFAGRGCVWLQAAKNAVTSAVGDVSALVYGEKCPKAVQQLRVSPTSSLHCIAVIHSISKPWSITSFPLQTFQALLDQKVQKMWSTQVKGCALAKDGKVSEKSVEDMVDEEVRNDGALQVRIAQVAASSCLDGGSGMGFNVCDVQPLPSATANDLLIHERASEEACASCDPFQSALARGFAEGKACGCKPTTCTFCALTKKVSFLVAVNRCQMLSQYYNPGYVSGNVGSRPSRRLY